MVKIVEAVEDEVVAERVQRRRDEEKKRPSAAELAEALRRRCWRSK